MKVTITDAMCNPEYNFNVFSITKSLQSGQVITGNYTHIMFNKGDKTIKLGIVVPMPHGAIYA